MIINKMEDTILQSLFFDNEFYSKSFGFLSSDHFTDFSDGAIFKNIKQFVNEHDSRPSLREIALQIKNSSKYNDKQKKEILEKLSNFSKFEKVENTQFLLKETEKFIKKTQLTQAIYESADILNKGEEFEPIISKVTDALNVNFDTTGGLDYNSTIEQRVEYYHQTLKGLSCGVGTADKILNGGFMDKTLNVFLSASGGGKSAALVSVGANLILKGKNVLYITLEMSEKEIAKRFDANILDYETKDLKNSSAEEVTIAFNNIKHTPGQLYIKEYSAGTFNTLQLKALIEDFKNSKGILFDVICIDYLTLMASYRTTLSKSGGTYGYYKSISEELHGFSKVCEANGNRTGIPIISASQLRREAFNNLEVGMDSISDSIGIIQTCDLVIGILSTEALRERKESIWRFMKNRNSGILKDIVVKTDFAKMRFSDAESSLDNISDVLSEENVKSSFSSNNSFGEFKF